MFDISKAQSIAKTAGNSHGADMLKDACNEIERLLAERDAALGENSTLRHAAATTASQSHSAVYSLRNRDVLKLLRALAAVHLAIALNKSLDLLTGFNYDEHRVKQCK